MIKSFRIGRFKWLHIMNPFRRANWQIIVKPGMCEIFFVCIEY